MNDTTWVKLHRKSLYNEIRRHDPTAWRLFETLLLLVDRTTGTWAGGIYQLTEADGYLNSSTIYKALIRLENNEMIVKKSNTRYSEIHICNFVEYHQTGNTSSPNQIQTKSKPSNTLTRIKNKELRNNSTAKNGVKKNDEFDSTYLQLNEFWSEKLGRKLSDNKTSRDALKKILKNHTPEQVQYAINGAVYFQGKQYKPQVLSFSSMYEKWDSLLGHMDSVKRQGEKNESNRF